MTFLSTNINIQSLKSSTEKHETGTFKYDILLSSMKKICDYKLACLSEGRKHHS